jgi:hypothetical protein
VAIFYCLIFEISLFVASCDSQDHGGGIRPRLHTGTVGRVVLYTVRVISNMNMGRKESRRNFFPELLVTAMPLDLWPIRTFLVPPYRILPCSLFRVGRT